MENENPDAVSQNSETTPEPLRDEDYIAIGRFIRATADFEDIIMLKLLQLTNLGVDLGSYLLGEKGMRNKIDLLSKLLKEQDPKEDQFLSEHIKPKIIEFTEQRRSIAHGVYMGRRPEDLLVFMGFGRITRASDIGLTIPGLSMRSADIASNANSINILTSILVRRWGMQPRLDTRQSQVGKPTDHNSRQPQKNQRKRSAPPPESSQG